MTAGTITLTGLASGGNGGNAWIPISAGAAEGTYSLRFRVENSDGQSAEVVMEDCVKVDATAPQASAASVPGGISFSPAPTWSLGYSDPLLSDGTAGSGVDKFRVKYGTTPGGDDLLAETGLFEVTEYTPPPVAASGTYYLSVRAVDRAGNISAWAVSSVQIVLEGPVMQVEPPVTKGLYNTVYWTNLPGTCQVKVYRDLDTTPDNGNEYVYTSAEGEPSPAQTDFLGFPSTIFYTVSRAYETGTLAAALEYAADYQPLSHLEIDSFQFALSWQPRVSFRFLGLTPRLTGEIGTSYEWQEKLVSDAVIESAELSLSTRLELALTAADTVSLTGVYTWAEYNDYALKIEYRRAI